MMMLRLVRILPMQPVLLIRRWSLTTMTIVHRIYVGLVPTKTATVIGNRANQRVMVVSYAAVLYGLTGILIRIRNSMTVAHPVPSLKKLNVDEDL